MTSAEATFHIGDTVVYAMQGIGRIKDITTRTTEGRQRDFYQIELGKNKGEVLVPCRRRLCPWPTPCAVGLGGPAGAPAAAASSLTASAAGTE